MALNRWRVVITDQDYKPLGELSNAYSRKLSRALNRTDTFTFKIRSDDQFSELVESLDFYVKVYRNDVLMFFGVGFSTQDQYDDKGGHIDVNCVAPTWVLPRRFPNKSANPVNYTGTRANIVTQLISVLNTQYLSLIPSPTEPGDYKAIGETGIGWSGTLNAGSTITYGCPPFRDMQSILDELSSSDQGFEWRILPHENWVTGGLIDQKIGYLTVGAPLGTETETRFALGEGQFNIRNHERSRSREVQGNYFTHLLNGQPETSPVSTHMIGPTFGVGDHDPASRTVGVMEHLIQGDLTVTAHRTSLVNAHLTARGYPRDVIVFTPFPDYGSGQLPEYGVDYEVGDFVYADATVNGRKRFSGYFRVWGITFEINEHGVETPDLLLSSESF